MVIPIRDSVRARTRSYVNSTLIALSAAVFLWQVLLDGPAVRLLALVPARIFDLPALAAAGFWPLLTLVTATFLHGNWVHLIGNMLFLWVFGDNVEDYLGHRRYLVFYLLGGVLANLSHVLANPLSQTPTIGASGAVAAVLGAYALLYPRATVLTLVPLGLLVPAVRVSARVLLGFWFLLQLWQGLTAPAAGRAPVAWWAHISGFLAGIGLVRMLAPPQREMMKER